LPANFLQSRLNLTFYELIKIEKCINGYESPGQTQPDMRVISSPFGKGGSRGIF